MTDQKGATKEKRITMKATVQRHWDAEALAAYRASLSNNEDFMARHRKDVASGKELWVDCHEEIITLISDDVIQIGRQHYAVGPVEDANRLRCLCFGCLMDVAYCAVNHQIRISDYTYDQLRQKARAALLPDGAIIRFHRAFDLGCAGKHDTFRKGKYAHRGKSRHSKEVSTVFFTLDTNTPFRVVHWQTPDWDVVSLPESEGSDEMRGVGDTSASFKTP